MSDSAHDAPPLGGARIFVVGSLNVDTTLSVDAHPIPGETVSASSHARGIGGKGGNQAIAASRAGGTVVMVGAVGSDADGASITDGLRVAGVDASGVERVDTETGMATVIVDAAGENVIVVSAGANAVLDDVAVAAALQQLNSGDVVVLQNEIRPAVTAHAAREAKRLGARVLWNAAPAPTERDAIPADADVVIVNAGELDAVATLIGVATDSVRDTVSALSRALEADIVCTLGAAGVLALLDGTFFEVAAPSVRAVDTTAAGDTFVGYFAARSDLPAEERLRTAATAGAVAVTRSGAAASIPDHAAVAAFFDAEPRKDPR